MNRYEPLAIACCCAKNEERYIDEWVQYYIWGLGFDKVVVYDNSTTNSLQYLIDKYAPLVDVIFFPQKQPQLDAYNDCLKKYKDNPTAWIAFFDVDEYLVLKKHRTIQSFLKDYKGHPAVVINWVFFGNSGHLTYKPTPMTQRFIRRAVAGSTLFKSIVHAASVKSMHVHTGTYHNNAYGVDTSFQLHDGTESSVVLHTAYLNHYYYKSLEEFKQKKSRSDVFYADKKMDYTLPCTNETIYSIPPEDFEKTRCLQAYNDHQVVNNEMVDESAKAIYERAQQLYAKWRGCGVSRDQNALFIVTLTLVVLALLCVCGTLIMATR